jgi:hypothetical protein
MKKHILFLLTFMISVGSFAKISYPSIGSAANNWTGDNLRITTTKLNNGLFFLDAKGTAEGIAISPTSTSTVTELHISLPIASNIGSADDCTGVGSMVRTTGLSLAGIVNGDSVADTGELTFISVDNVSNPYRVIFTYEVL